MSLSDKRKALFDAMLKEQGVKKSKSDVITRTEFTNSIPLSFAQERLWFLEQLAPGNPVYNIPAPVRLKGPLDVVLLEDAFNEIVKRQDSLRTRFSQQAGHPVVEIAPQLTIYFNIIDLRSQLEESREELLHAAINEEARHPFDLANAPLVRVTIWQIDEEDHLFLLMMHHSISEAWSVALLFRELEQIYQSKLDGSQPDLPELPVQYSDYARWQRDRFKGEHLREQESYWKERLAGDIPLLQLPGDHPRQAVQSQNGAIYPLRLPQKLCEKLQGVCNQHGVTQFMTLLAAFQVLLFRYTGEQDLLIGSPASNRNRSELENLIGFFVNTLVLRTDLSGNPRFNELLQRVRETALGAFEHQDVQFEHLVQLLKLDRDLSHNPLFQVMFALQNTPMPSLHLEGIRQSEMLGHDKVHSGTTKVDLSMVIEVNDPEWIVWVEYNSDLFELSTIQRLLGHFNNLLVSIIQDPTQRISELTLMGDQERQCILQDWNDTGAAYDLNQCVHLQFEKMAQRYPDAIALCARSTRVGAPGSLEQFDYQSLNRNANQVAHYLKSLGVQAEDFVAVCAERSIESVVAILGILKCGATYVPLDPKYPTDRLAYVLQDSGASILLTQDHLVESLPGDEVQLVRLDTDWDSISQQPEVNPDSQIDPKQLAYMIYTSGSTGRPKGVEIEHRSLANLTAWHQSAYGVSPKDRATLLAGPAFDASVWETWPYLTAGASLHVPDEEVLLSPLRLNQWLSEQKISLCFLPTPLAEAVLKEPVPEDLQLRVMLTGGDKLRPGDWGAFPYKLVNHYGPTENTVVTTCATLAIDEETDTAPPIGRPISNTQVYIVDPYMQPVPIGVPGELLIGGASLARGYHNRSELNAEKFIQDHFSNDPDARLYRTGDLVRYLPDGNIEFLGRIDDQVKIRGFRIELGEIESNLMEHQNVREAVVIVRDDMADAPRLAAYVVCESQKTDTSEIRQFLKTRLPDYMVPADLMCLKEIPLTPNGKINRRALPKPDAAQTVQISEQLVPTTELEQTIARVWQDVLKIDRVGTNSNFFDLGGHSMLMAEVHEKLHASLRKEISMLDLFKYPTISGLASYFGHAGSEQVTLEQSQDRAQTRKAMMQKRKQTRAKR